jgi:hypothetical protein
MFAAHFAVGLAIGARARQALMSALLAGAFLPDVVWIGLAAARVEPSAPSVFFDGWSHSFVSVLVEATVFALFFARKGVRVWLPVWLAVMSHVVPDAIIHPSQSRSIRTRRCGFRGTCGPGARCRQGLAFRITGGSSSQSWLRFSAVYVTASLRSSFPRNLVGATVLLMLGLY